MITVQAVLTIEKFRRNIQKLYTLVQIMYLPAILPADVIIYKL